MRPPLHRFRTEGTVDGPPPEVLDVLADLAAYPAWWPQVRAVARVDDDTALVVCRSALPYSLELTLTRLREDRAAGVLEVGLSGDLDGWSRWRADEVAGRTRLVYEQEVTTTGRLLTLASRVGTPVLRANHAWMMRGARRGLPGAVQERSSAGR